MAKNAGKVQYWQLIGIPRPINSYCFYKDICPSPNLLQLPILHLYGGKMQAGHLLSVFVTVCSSHQLQQFIWIRW